MTAFVFHKRRQNTGGGFRDGQGYMPCENGCKSGRDGLYSTGTHVCTILDRKVFLCARCCREARKLIDEVLS